MITQTYANVVGNRSALYPRFPKGGQMAKERSGAMLSSMNRRKMLGTGVGLLASAVTVSAGSALAQEKETHAATGAKLPTAATGPNLSPPVVTVKGGKLRGLREGKTYSFLGV